MPDYPFEIIKIMLLVRSAWEAEDAEDISQNIIVLGRRFLATVLAKKSPFSLDEIDAISELSERYRMNVLYVPRSDKNNRDLEAAITAPDINRYI